MGEPVDRSFWRAIPATGRWRRARPGTASPSVEAGFAITDPAKLTLLTPGFDRKTGAYEAHGIPAPVVAQYLRENRVVPEKNDLNSLLFLLTPGVELSKAGTLVSALVAFKRLHDENALLDDVMPEFVAKRPQRYKGKRLRDLCGEMHAYFREADVSALQKAPVRARASAEHGDDAARGRRAIWCATTSTICPIDEIDGPRRDDAVRRLSPGHRDDRAGRAARRARAADDRLSEGVRARGQPVPGLRSRKFRASIAKSTRSGVIRFYTYVVRE